MAMNKKEIGAITELRRHMGVLVEGLRSEIKVVAEQHGSIITKFEEHDGRFDNVDRRLNVIEIDLKGIKAALFDVSHRIDSHEVRICRFEGTK